ncbi:MAG: four helix bundle protein [Alistipes sp.]|nr:four helix bundle protein [Alistipes sp.]
MAVYDNLPAYKAAYDLLLDVFKMNINLTREHRFTLGEKLKLELIELIKCIYRANSSELAKEQNLRSAREHIVVVKLYMRILHDLKQISLKRFVALSERTEDLSKQITAWHKSAAKKRSAAGPESVQVL